RPLVHMLLEELFTTQTFRQTHEGHRSILEVREDRRRDFFIVNRDVELGHAARCIDDSVRVADRDLADVCWAWFRRFAARVGNPWHGAPRRSVAGFEPA